MALTKNQMVATLKLNPYDPPTEKQMVDSGNSLQAARYVSECYAKLKIAQDELRAAIIAVGGNPDGDAAISVDTVTTLSGLL